MHTNTINRSKTFGIEFDQNRFKPSNFLKIFSTLCNLYKLRVIELIICVWILILSDVSYKIWWDSVEAFNFQTNLNFLIFFIVISNFKISMYPWSSLCEEAKIKQHTFSKKELGEIGKEGFTCFFFLHIFVTSRTTEIMIESNF